MIAYLDLPAGLSGDMFLGCLVDAGWPIDRLRSTIARLKLPSDEWRVEARQVQKGPLRATQVEVRINETHHHRHLSHIRKIIEAADLPAAVRQRAIAVFTRLASAEAKVHGMPIEKVHFHEVGALDAIIDIVGSVAGLSELAIERVYASALPLGGGWADTAHGRIPLPAPATIEILAAADAPTCPAPGNGECVTPTGAALAAELATFVQPAMTVSRIGIGAGQRDCAWPNIARIWLGEPVAAPAPAGDADDAAGKIVQLDTNIDDMNPQLYSAVSDRLFAAGARDVWLTPVQMKKNRPGVVLSVLASAASEAELADVMLRETTTLGVRVHRLDHRHEARREIRTVETQFGPVRAKIKWVQGEAVAAAPEYADCVALAESARVPVRMIYDAAVVAAHGILVECRSVDSSRKA